MHIIDWSALMIILLKLELLMFKAIFFSTKYYEQFILISYLHNDETYSVNVRENFASNDGSVLVHTSW